MFCETRDRPQIDYPCPWEYRAIGADLEALEVAVREVFAGEELTLREGKVSPKGRWHSVGVEVVVRDEGHRDDLHRRLREHPAVRMVF